MQLMIEVLPAPLGPMIENNSPSFTPKLTSVSARTPPKRSDTPRTSKACSTHSLHWHILRFLRRNTCSLYHGVLHALGCWRLSRSVSRTYLRRSRHHIQLWGAGPQRLGLGRSIK